MKKIQPLQNASKLIKIEELLAKLQPVVRSLKLALVQLNLIKLIATGMFMKENVYAWKTKIVQSFKQVRLSLQKN